jgi:Rod binding domain-containing protein
MRIATPPIALRQDFQRALESQAHVGFDSLPKDQQARLLKLQTAAENFEAIFVKGLLDQARRVRFAEPPSAVRDMAEEMACQAMAEQVARNRPGIGLAKLVFVETAQSIVKSSHPTGTRDHEHHE